MKAMSSGILERKLKKVLKEVDARLDEARRVLDAHVLVTPEVVEKVPPVLLEANYRVTALKAVRARLVKEFQMLGTVSQD